MTIILCGTSETIPAEVIRDLTASARAGSERLAIVDEGSQLVRRYGEIDRDVVLDPARGNWGFFADHVTEIELAHAGEAILQSPTITERAYNGASCVLSSLLWQAADEPGGQLSDVSKLVRGLSYTRLSEALRLDLDDSVDTRIGWSALAMLQEHAGRFAPHCPTLPLVSIRRWLTAKPRSVLFITTGAGVHDGACRSVAAALERITTLEADAGCVVDIAWNGANRSPVSADRARFSVRLMKAESQEGRC